MTNEELAELERRIVAGYEGGEKTDDGSQSWGLGFEAGVRAALSATAREAEALRAENAELLFAAYKPGYWDGVEDGRDDAQHKDCVNEGYQNWLSNTPKARAALEQGEVKCTRN